MTDVATTPDTQATAPTQRIGGAALEDHPPGRHARRHARRSGRLLEWAGIVGFVVAALVITGRLWLHDDTAVAHANPQDQEFFEWVLSHAAYSLTHGENPLFTDRMNAPVGVNLMANTSVLAIGFLLAPITLLFGAHVSFLCFATAALAGTATAWYFFLSRVVVSARVAAYVGAAFCGFAPGLIAHVGGQPNIAAQFLIPLILWCLVRLRDPDQTLRFGLILGGLLIAQVFVNEEILFFAALACVVLIVGYAIARPQQARREIRPVARGLGVAAVLAGVVLAYPLWWQFFGPQRYSRLSFHDYVADLGSFPAFARESLAGSTQSAADYTTSASEDNAFFGWPLLIVVAVALWWLRRDLRAQLTGAVGIVFALLALGPDIYLGSEPLGIPGPMALLSGLPIINLVTVMRLALVTAAAIGVLIAITVDAVLARPLPRWQRSVALSGVALALLPVLPTPLSADGRPPVPRFVADGSWRQQLDADETVMVVPMWSRDTTGMRWAVHTGLEMRLAHGYFLAPDEDGVGNFSAPLRPTSKLLINANEKRKVPIVTNADRRQARRDLDYWHVGLLVLNPASFNEEVRTTLVQLFGPAQNYHGTLCWTF